MLLAARSSEEMGGPHPLREALSGLAPPDHLCLLYGTEKERLEAMVPYFLGGLARGDMCVLHIDEPGVEALLSALRGMADVEAALRSGALVVADVRDAYLREESFDADTTLHGLEALARQAVEAGFHAVRACGDIRSLLDRAPDVAPLLDYEVRCNETLARLPVTKLCMYDRRAFDAGTLFDVLHAHPHVVAAGHVSRNLCYAPVPEDATPDKDARIERFLKNLVAQERAEADLRSRAEALERRLSERTHALGDALQEVDLFNSVLAHDLKEPVRGVLACVRAVEEDARRFGSPPELVQNAVLAHHAARRLDRLVQGILDHGRTMESEITQPVWPSVLLSGSEMRGFALSRSRIEVAPDIPPVMARPSALRQVLHNLLTNAVKHNPRPDARVLVQGWDVGDGRVEISIEDNGPGMPPDVLAAFGNPLGAGGTTPLSRGRFGLFITRRAVARMGGTLSYGLSSLGGTAVRITLPAAEGGR